jgi:hypothetical protein
MTKAFRPLLLSGFLFIIISSSFAQQSELVFLENGKLSYTPFAMEGQTNKVNTVPDFSYAGYMGGGVSLPTDIPIRATVTTEAGDDTKRIQDAIDAVSALALIDGFRGAVLIKAGNYSINQPLEIRTSGVILRGEGQGYNGTVIHSNLRRQHSILSVIGASGLAVSGQTTQVITSPYVAVGTYSFDIADASDFAIGDTIVVTRTPNQQWILDLKVDQATMCAGDNDCSGWTTASYSIDHERVITDLSGNTITINIPIVDVMEEKYGGGRISKAGSSGRISNCGVESIRFESFYDSGEDEEHAWVAVELRNAEHCWVKEVTGAYMGYGTVTVNGSNFNTIQDCANISPVSIVTGGRRYSFYIGSGLGNFFQRCYTYDGRHDYVLGSRVTGPNVFLDSYAEKTNSDIGPHHRWSVGSLFDNILGGQSRVQYRGNSGTGHGWAGAQTLFWNLESEGGDIKVESPPGSKSWGIGCGGPTQNGNGYWESWGENVLPRSIYMQQLEDRLGSEAVYNVVIPEQKQGDIYDLLKTWKGYGALKDGGLIGQAPTISFTSPAANFDLKDWSDTALKVETSDADGQIVKVKYLINGEPIAELTQAPFTAEDVLPLFQSLDLGLYLLRAEATDNDGNVSITRRKMTISPPDAVDRNQMVAIDLCDAQAPSNDGYVAQYATDGDLTNASRWSSTENGAMLIVEACEPQQIEVLGIKWYRGNERKSYFDLETSLNGYDWKKLLTNKSSSGLLNDFEPFPINDSIKFIRYTGYGNSSSSVNSIIEIGFFVGKKADPIDTTSTILLNAGLESQKMQMELFPNPSSHFLSFKSGLSDKTGLRIIDISGHYLLSETFENGEGLININTLKKGLYILEISNKDGFQHRRFIKD